MAGRPAAARLSAEQVAEARGRHSNGESIRALAREFGVAHSTLAAHLQAAEQAEPGAAARAPAPAEAPTRTPLASEREREGVHRRAVARAADAEVARLEAAYQQAFAALETLVGAIERVLELRGQQRAWEEANKLGLAPMRPEPWRVRVGRDPELRPLYKRFTDAVNSRW
jgi:transposase-like protein